MENFTNGHGPAFGRPSQQFTPQPNPQFGSQEPGFRPQPSLVPPPADMPLAPHRQPSLVAFDSVTPGAAAPSEPWDPGQFGPPPQPGFGLGQPPQPGFGLGQPGLPDLPEFAEPARFNRLAIVAFVLSVIGIPVFPIVLGHIALRQLKQQAERGRVLALIGVVLGYIGSAAIVGFGLFVIIVLLSGQNIQISY